MNIKILKWFKSNRFISITFIFHHFLAKKHLPNPSNFAVCSSNSNPYLYLILGDIARFENKIWRIATDDICFATYNITIVHAFTSFVLSCILALCINFAVTILLRISGRL